MTLKREGGTFSFSLRISEGYSGTAIVALAVPTRVRLTLTHAIWPTYKLGHLIGFRGGTERTSTRWISIQTDRSLQMTNMPFCLFSQGAPTRQSSPKPSGFNTEGNPQASTPRDAGGASLLSGRHPRLQCDWISSGTAPEREARTNGVYPSSSTPSMIDHVIPHRAPTVIYVGTTRRQRMRCLSGLAWPPLL